MMRSLANRLDLCSINTATLGFQAPLHDVIDAVARAGFGGIAPWRREVEGLDVAGIARQIRKSGLKVTSYCRSTYLPASSRPEFLANVASNRRGIEDAALLGAQAFLLVVGSLPDGSKDIDGAREQVAEGISHLLDHAKACGVRLALEPLHPVYAADRSCITTLAESLELCERLEPTTPRAPWLGTGIDVYHVWWDPTLMAQIKRAGDQRRIFAFHVNDWLLHTKDILNDRGMMGDGVIDIRKIRSAVEAAGFNGLMEVEIFSSENWWKRPMAEILKVCVERLMTRC
jgi:sugar phosphate isomerase/epimerase